MRLRSVLVRPIGRSARVRALAVVVAFAPAAGITLGCGGASSQSSALPARAQAGDNTPISSPASLASLAPPPREDGQLPALAAPKRYDLKLDVDPRKDTFSGRIAIAMEVKQATSFLVLHGRDIAVKKAYWQPVPSSPTGDGQAPSPSAIGNRTPRNEAQATARNSHGGTDAEELVFSFAHPLPVGPGELVVEYTAPFADSLSGLYRTFDAGRAYAFTQFEATDARRAFPCFDEPRFKVPFAMTVRIPKGMNAVSNGAETSRHDEAGDTTIAFAETLPLPTYLIALAVGDLDIRSASEFGVAGNGSPRLAITGSGAGASNFGDPASPVVRIVTTHGKTALGERAVSEAMQLTRALGEYFGIPYPFGKLDLVAVPDFRAGAMENAGLITFREELILQDSLRASSSDRREQSLVIAHELAHQWFGDLVTMPWWNDLWLNEGFAAWMESKIVDVVHPSLQQEQDDIAGKYAVMDSDALTSARAVRQPVSTSAEADEAFDGITYVKGAAVLGMLESYVGPQAFRAGLRAYMAAHAYGSATATDLFDALGRQSGQDVGGIAATFLDRPGVPNVTVKTSCNGGRLAGIELSQARWVPLGIGAGPGAEASAAAAGAAERGEKKARAVAATRAVTTKPEMPWRIPVCLRIGGSHGPTASCTELRDGHVTVPPSVASGTGAGAMCPTWIYPNASDAGYYRFSFADGAEGFMALAKNLKALTPENRIGLLSNLWAQVKGGRVEAETLFRVLPAYDQETDRHVVGAVVDLLDSMHGVLIDDAHETAFRAFAAARLEGQKRRLLSPLFARVNANGPRVEIAKAGPARSDDDAELRDQIFFALGDLAEDDDARTFSDTLATAWLNDAPSIDPNLAASAIRLSSRTKGDSRLTELREVARNASLPARRVIALSAMAAFRDRGVAERALGLTLTEEVRLQDIRYVVRGARHGAGPSQSFASDWVKAHWGALRSRARGALALELIDDIGTGCQQGVREDAESFLKAHAGDLEGAERRVKAHLEGLTVCAAIRTHAAPSVASALESGRFSPIPAR